MAQLAAAGVRLRIVAVTDGEGSHPRTDPGVIAARRVAESVAALRVTDRPEEGPVLTPQTVAHFTRPAELLFSGPLIY